MQHQSDLGQKPSATCKFWPENLRIFERGVSLRWPLQHLIPVPPRLFASLPFTGLTSAAPYPCATLPLCLSAIHRPDLCSTLSLCHPASLPLCHSQAWPLQHLIPVPPRLFASLPFTGLTSAAPDPCATPSLCLSAIHRPDLCSTWSLCHPASLPLCHSQAVGQGPLHREFPTATAAVHRPSTLNNTATCQ